MSHLTPVGSSFLQEGRTTIRPETAYKNRAWQEDAPPHLPAPAPEGTLRLRPMPSPADQRPLQAAAAAPAPTQACGRTLEPSCAPAAREGPPGPPAGSRSRAVQGALKTAAPHQPGRPPLCLLHGQSEINAGVSHAGSSHRAAARGKRPAWAHQQCRGLRCCWPAARAEPPDPPAAADCCAGGALCLML